MDADDKLAKRVAWLNSQGGFNNVLLLDKIMEVANGLEITYVMKVLKDVEEKQASVRDPNAYVCAALRKAGTQGQGAGYGGGGFEWGGAAPPRGSAPAPGASAEAEDAQLRQKIDQLNQEVFEGRIEYDKIIAAAMGLEYAKVLQLMQHLEEKGAEVKDPNAWVCSALRKAASGGKGGGKGGWAGGAGMPQPAAAFGSYGSFGPPAAAAAPGCEADQKLHKRIMWLNTQGGFNGAIDAEAVANAAFGLGITDVMKILKDAEEKKDGVKDPTAYVSAALRKMGGGQRHAAAGGYGGAGGGGAGYGGGYQAAMPQQQAMPQQAMPQQAAYGGAGYGGGGAGWGGPADWSAAGTDPAVEDQKLRKKIGWLNHNGYDGGIIYDKIIAAAKGLEYAQVIKVVGQLEEKVGQVNDPTAWVCSALRKAGGGGMPGFGAPAAGYGAQGGFAPPPRGAPAGMPFGGGGGGGGGGAMPMDVDADTFLRKKIGWLNKAGGFENQLNYQKVAEAAAGVDVQSVKEVFDDVEAKRAQIKDPTAYAAAALRKRGLGGMGVRRTIMKR